jgi:hypothetical protein
MRRLITNRRVLGVVVAVGMASCAPEATDEPLQVGELEFMAITPASFAAGQQTWAESGSANFMSTAAAYSFSAARTVNDRYHILQRGTGPAEGPLHILNIQADPGSPNYGQVIVAPTLVDVCPAGICVGRPSAAASTSYLVAPNTVRAFFGYFQGFVAADPVGTGLGFASIQSLTVTGVSKTHETILGSCGATAGLAGRCQGLSAASRNNSAFTAPRIMIAALRTDHPGNDWYVATSYHRPDVHTTSSLLTHTLPCPSSPCTVSGGANPGYTAVGYNQLEDQFLVVSAFAGGHIQGRWFLAATGQPLGSVNIAVSSFKSIGVACLPDAIQNPLHECIVMTDGAAWSVQPDSTVTPLPPSQGEWTDHTLQAISTSDGFDYERMGGGEVVAFEDVYVQRYSSDFAANQGFLLANESKAEDLAYDYGNRSLAVWSTAGGCGVIPGYCGDLLYWQIIDR